LCLTALLLSCCCFLYLKTDYLRFVIFFLAAVVHTLHSIWLARNIVRFSSNASSLQAVQLRVQAATFMTGNLSVGKCVASDATVLDTFSICPHNCHIRYIIMVTWKAPSARWLKVNTDGSVVWSLGACGGLFRDHSALFLETLHLILERPMFSLLKFMVKFWLWSMQPVMVGETSS
jgi:hypothetical protein